MRTSEGFVQTPITLRATYSLDRKNADRGVNPCRREIYQSSMMLLPVISFGTGSPM